MSDLPIPTERIGETVERAVRETPILDVHTHIYPGGFGGLCLRGVDELIRYHYLIAEVARGDRSVSPADFWALSDEKQAEHIWETLFEAKSPISEACRGVLTTLAGFDLDVASRDLGEFRSFFAGLTAEAHISKVFELANVSHVVMTNDPFDAAEREAWESGVEADARFLPALRVDRLMGDWGSVASGLEELGYDLSGGPSKVVSQVRRFLDGWAARMEPVYLAMSLPADYTYPEGSTRGQMMRECILPFCRDAGLPLAMMIGVHRQMNPALKLAGDAVGKCDITAVANLCEENDDIRFLVTLLSRENQHELAVTARKFPNLMPFGCWWFLNNPSLIEEITTMRLELLGLGFIPQHSDARVLDQLVYKWAHSREVVGQALAAKYRTLIDTGWTITEAEVQRDVSALLRDNFIEYCGIADRVG